MLQLKYSKKEVNVNIITEKKRITVKYERLVLDDGFVFEDFGDLLNLLDDLESVDSYFDTFLIYNTKNANKLQELGVVSKSSRGSYGRGKNYKSFYNEINMLYFNKSKFDK